MRLDKEDTSALIAFGRKEGLTVNALVSAAIARAHAKAGEAPLLHMYYVDLRHRVTPPIGFTEVTNMLGNAYFPALSNVDLVTLAHQVKEQFTSDLQTGILHRNFSGTNPPELSNDTSSHLVITTNWGIIPELRSPTETSIVDFQSFFSPSPLVSAFAKLTGKSLTGYVIHTFDQQLSIEFIPGELARDEQLLASIREELRPALEPI